MSLIKSYIIRQVAANALSKEEASKMLAELKTKPQVQEDEIAVIGMACRFPGANSIEQYWDNLINGRNCIGQLSSLRKKDYLDILANKSFRNSMINAQITEEDIRQGRVEFAEAGYLDEIDKFDADFFRISTNEAMFIDPIQRVFMETAMEAIEDAGYGGKKIYGTRTAIYVGRDHTNSSIYSVATEPHAMHLTGSWAGILATRLSYLLNLNGSGMVIDTACSSGATAIHEACQALKSGECDYALAGGVHLSIQHDIKGQNSMMSMVESGDSVIRTFDKRANGTVWGEGVGVLMLKPLSKAALDRDNVYAVIKGSAVNNDGASNGITSPNAYAQEKVIIQAWKQAGINPESISYVEAHGTGTVLGDPIEVKGLSNAFSKYTQRKQFCAIGSVKTTIGHVVAASGVASVIKVILSMKKGIIPAITNFEEPNPYINFCESPMYVNDTSCLWERGEHPRRAGVSSFGFSGTNCHIVLEEAGEARSNHGYGQQGLNIFTISAIKENVLYDYIDRYMQFFEGGDVCGFMDTCFTANTGRGHYAHRLAFVAGSIEELKAKILSVKQNGLLGLEEGVFYGYHNIMPKRTDTAKEINTAKSEKIEASRLAEEFISDRTISGMNDRNTLNELCKLYVRGADISWTRIYGERNFSRAHLPGYPFERVRLWARVRRDAQDDYTNDAAESEVKIWGREQQDYTGMETRVALAWSKALGTKQVNIFKSFYEEGGDSIFAMRIASILKEQGIKVQAKDVLERQTVQKIAQMLNEEPDNPRCELVTGEINLIPSQIRFYNRIKTNPDYWNISSILYCREGFKEEWIRKVLHTIVVHHDALRIVFRIEGGAIKQYNRGLEGDLFDLKVFDFSDNSGWEEKIPQEAFNIHSSINLNTGPLIKLGLFKTPNGDHLLFAIHHLVCDGISLSIIIEDFVRGYAQCANNAEIVLPSKTLSFKEWSELLYQYAGSDEVVRETGYWLNIKNTEVSAMPKDNIVADRIMKNREVYTASLQKEDTNKLLKKSCIKFGAGVEELLLAALALGLREWMGAGRVMLRMSGNGRSGLLDQVDIERTVGWLAIVYPLILDLNLSEGLNKEQQAVQAVEKVKEAVSSLPSKGLKREILEFLTPQEKKDFAELKDGAEIFFNYLGQFKSHQNKNPLGIKLSDLQDAMPLSPQSEMEYALEIFAHISDERLSVDFKYDKGEYNKSTIERLANEFMRGAGRIANID